MNHEYKIASGDCIDIPDTNTIEQHAMLRGIHIYVPPYGVLFFVIGVLAGILLVTLGVGIVLNFL